MISELSAAMTAIRETTGLVKLISDAKTDAEIKFATIELQNKLLTLQSDCFALGDVICSRDEDIVHLKAEIADFKDFERQTEGYVLDQLESETLLYSKKQTVNGKEITVHLCPNCFSRRVISLLQPLQINEHCYFHRSYCLSCEHKFNMNKNESYKHRYLHKLAKKATSSEV